MRGGQQIIIASLLKAAADRSFDALDTEEQLEAARRSAVSRAYYGAFTFARRVAWAQGYPKTLRGKSVHFDLWTWWEQHDVDIAARGFDLSKLRKIADYDMDEEFGEEMLDAVGEGLSLIQDCASVFASDTPEGEPGEMV